MRAKTTWETNGEIRSVTTIPRTHELDERPLRRSSYLHKYTERWLNESKYEYLLAYEFKQQANRGKRNKGDSTVEFSVFTTCVETKVLLTVSLNRSVLHLPHAEIYRREDDSRSMAYEVSERFEELSIDGANGIIAVTFGVCTVVISRFVLDRRYRDDATQRRKRERSWLFRRDYHLSRATKARRRRWREEKR